MTENSRYYSLDLWRGVACLMVVAFHATGPDLLHQSVGAVQLALSLTAAGWLGVPIFFVISGYCIAAAADRASRESMRWSTFVWRRIRRIFPPYIAVLAGTALFSFLAYRTSAGVILFGHRFGGFGPIMDPSARTGWSWIGDATLTAGLLQSPGTGERTFWLGHAWSLSYEEQFYAVIGVLLAFSQRKWLRTAGLVTVTLTAIQVLNPRVMQAKGGAFLNGHWQLFALGLALFHWRVRALGAARLLVPIAVVLAAGWAVFQENFGGTSFPTELGAAAIATALMAVLSDHDIALYRAPLLSGLRWCGERCYSVYLVHWPVTKAITGFAVWTGLTSPAMVLCVVLPAALVVSLIGAAFFHAMVERRFLNSSPSASPDFVLPPLYSEPLSHSR